MATLTDVATNQAVIANMGQIAEGRDEATLCAVLGSCIGATLYHPKLKFGVMAHIVLPKSAGRAAAPGKFADTAIPHMVSLLEQAGANRQGIVAKIAGGASMFGKANSIQIGKSNADAVSQALIRLGIRVAGQHIGGEKGRRVTLRLSDGSLLVEVVGASSVTI